ncbi:hypothetical protein Tco_1039343 [Tanacetum coccineum]
MSTVSGRKSLCLIKGEKVRKRVNKKGRLDGATLEQTLNNARHAEFEESNAIVLERFYTSAGNPVKEILLKLNLPDHRILKDGGKVLKLKNFKKDATLKLSKSTNQEWYEHVGPEVTRSQDERKFTSGEKVDYSWLMILHMLEDHISTYKVGFFLLEKLESAEKRLEEMSQSSPQMGGRRMSLKAEFSPYL